METVKYIEKVVVILLFLAPIFGCGEEIAVDLRSAEPNIVIEGSIGYRQSAAVKVSLTQDFGDSSPVSYLDDAVVTLTDNNGTSEVLSYDSSVNIYYSLLISGKIGHQYSLSVEYRDKEYVAHTTMPPKVDIDSITIFNISGFDIFQPMIHFTDPVGEENQYYKFEVQVDSFRVLGLYNVVSSEHTDGLQVSRIIALPKNLTVEQEIYIELHTIDKGAYKFFSTLNNIGGSLANPTSNFSNGALGCFFASAVATESYIVR